METHPLALVMCADAAALQTSLHFCSHLFWFSPFTLKHVLVYDRNKHIGTGKGRAWSELSAADFGKITAHSITTTQLQGGEGG